MSSSSTSGKPMQNLCRSTAKACPKLRCSPAPPSGPVAHRRALFSQFKTHPEIPYPPDRHLSAVSGRKADGADRHGCDLEIEPGQSASTDLALRPLSLIAGKQLSVSGIAGSPFGSIKALMVSSLTWHILLSAMVSQSRLQGLPQSHLWISISVHSVSATTFVWVTN